MTGNFDDLMGRIDELSEEQLSHGSEKYSFDLGIFKLKIYNAEPWTQIIIAHLYVDHVLNELLSIAFVVPSAVNISRMGFSQKVSLCAALGAIDNDIPVALNAVNGIRNGLAHSLKFEVTGEEIRRIVKSLPCTASEALQDLSSTPLQWSDERRRLLRCLCVVVLYIESQRHRFVRSRLISAKRRRNLELALEHLNRIEREEEGPDSSG